MKLIEVEFTKIVGEGKSLGRKDGKVVFAYGVIPGETAIIKVNIEKRNFIEGEVVEIKNKSPYRIEPVEDHFLSCSPWQIIDYKKQIEYKKKLIEDLLIQTTKENIILDKFYPATDILKYRTKMEYSFIESDDKLHLAFHKRGDYSTKLKLPSGCVLIDDESNKLALDIVELLRKEKVSGSLLKTLVIRSSKRYGERSATLFVKDKDFRFNFNGDINIVYSNPVSCVSSVDEIIKKGKDFLTEKVCGMDFKYGFDCFFQNNVELFEKVIEEIKGNIGMCDKIIDLYAGVGVIGLSLGRFAKKLFLIESNYSSAIYASINAQNNNISNCEVINSMVERIDLPVFFDADVLICDPPRAGLCKKVIKNILKYLPKRIIYLSCNPITQGRDLNFLLEKYAIIRAVGFDFYPNTPHMESLVFLDKK